MHLIDPIKWLLKYEGLTSQLCCFIWKGYFLCQVVIEAVMGNGALGDIAIDDVSFSVECSLSSGTVTLYKTMTVYNPLQNLKFFIGNGFNASY